MITSIRIPKSPCPDYNITLTVNNITYVRSCLLHQIPCQQCPPYAQHKNAVAKRIIQTITEKAGSIMIDSQAPLFCLGEALNGAVYLHQRTPNEGLTKPDDRDGYQAPYQPPYKILHGFGKPFHNNYSEEISYKAPLHHLPKFGCYASQLITELQRHAKFNPRSKLCMMVGYVHDSTTLRRICNSAFQVVRSQSEVIFDIERNAHTLCPNGDQTDTFGLPEGTEYVDEIEMGGDGLHHDHAGMSGTGEPHGSCDHDCTDHDTDHNLPDADNRRSIPASTGV